MRSALVVTSLASLFILSAGALASPEFPGTIRDHVGASRAPACIICHATAAGGSGTVTKDFGLAMMDAGLQAGDTAALTAALDQFQADGVDTDGDGTIDFDELAAGTDPNIADGNGGGGGGGGDPARYGVGCASTTIEGTGLFAIFAVILGACFRVNRSSRSRATR
jgi:hypothetical protein